MADAQADEDRQGGLAAAALTIAWLILSTGLPKLAVDRLVGENLLPSWPLFAGFYVLAAFALRHRIARLPIGRADLVLIATLIGLPIVSSLWSVDRSTSLQHGMMFLAAALVALALAAAPDHAAMRALARASIITPLLSFSAIVLAPEIGLEQDGPWTGAWRGLQEQKNSLGAVSALSSLLLLAALLRGNVLARGALVFGIVANLGLLLGAQSTTAMIVFALGAAVLVLPRRLLGRAAFGLPAVTIALLAAVVLLPELTQSLLDLGSRSVGKDATLSNRLPIWNILLPHAQQRPWLGYGFDAFWAPAIFPLVEFAKALNFVPSTAHNGFLETALSLGSVGLLVLLALLGRMAVNGARGLDREATQATSRLALAVLVMAIGLNLTESAFLARNDRIAVTLLWLALVAARRAEPPAAVAASDEPADECPAPPPPRLRTV